MSSHASVFVDLVALPEGPHPIPFRTRSLSPPGPMVLRLKARESRSPPGRRRVKLTGTNHPIGLIVTSEKPMRGDEIAVR